jgi:hypothetical protein
VDLEETEEDQEGSVEEEDSEIEEDQEDLGEEEDSEIEEEEDLEIEGEEEEEEEHHLILIEDLYFHLLEREVRCYDQILLKICDFNVINLLGKYFILLFEGRLIMMVCLDDRVKKYFQVIFIFCAMLVCNLSDGLLCVPCGEILD